MTNGDRFSVVVFVVTAIVAVVMAVTVVRAFIDCRKHDGALVQAIDWPPVACISTTTDTTRAR